MKHGKIFFLILLFLPLLGIAQFVALPKDAKFSFGDNPAWAGKEFNDSDWIVQQLAKSFTKDSSYAWYRISVVIPSSLKTKDGRGLKLLLGKIDDADQTWFNGKKIGETGSFPPAYVTQWEKQRLYIIPESEVQWDKENSIAVRIYNLIGGMGMWEGPYRIEPLGWTDELTITREVTEASDNGVQLKLIFANSVNKVFTGSVYIGWPVRTKRRYSFLKLNKYICPPEKR